MNIDVTRSYYCLKGNSDSHSALYIIRLKQVIMWQRCLALVKIELR